MTRKTRHNPTIENALRCAEVIQHLRRFGKDESGVMTIFAVMMFLMMLLVGGIGVDLMHSEMERTKLQATVDRAVLAAADLDQTLDPSAVVNDYFAKANMSSYLQNVSVQQGINFRTVTATASTDTKTQFMHLMGVDTITSPAVGTAEERIPKVEVSLVLDISGSMRWNSKLQNMKTASKKFLSILLRPETAGQVSVSVIPYAEHVNIGPDIFKALPKVDAKHNYSHCAEFPDASFSTTTFDTDHLYAQMQHFQWYEDSENKVNNPSCPQRKYERVHAISDDLTYMNWMIDRFQARTQTSIFLGMKWATSLLDPSFQPVNQDIKRTGDYGTDFTARPAPYTDNDTLKTIVVMTDGQNTQSYRLSDWAYSTSSKVVHWKNNNLWNYLNKNVHPSQHYKYFNMKYSGSYGDTLTQNICDAAKDKGIVIWAVGFETSPHGTNTMKNCASSESHFFEAQGTELTEVFTAIARSINQLRLTQ